MLAVCAGCGAPESLRVFSFAAAAARPLGYGAETAGPFAPAPGGGGSALSESCIGNAALRTAILAESPDIVGLQGISAADAEALCLPEFQIAGGVNAEYVEASAGAIVLFRRGRLTLRANGCLWLADERAAAAGGGRDRPEAWSGGSFATTPIATWARLRLRGWPRDEVLVISTWLPAIDAGRRVAAARAVRQFTDANADGAVVLMGDLGCARDSEACGVLTGPSAGRAGLRDAGVDPLSSASCGAGVGPPPSACRECGIDKYASTWCGVDRLVAERAYYASRLLLGERLEIMADGLSERSVPGAAPAVVAAIRLRRGTAGFT